MNALRSYISRNLRPSIAESAGFLACGAGILLVPLGFAALSVPVLCIAALSMVAGVAILAV